MIILGHEVLFDEKTHVYTVDGVVVPSVSKILGTTLFKSKYDGVSSFVLDNAASFGSGVHHAIETDDISNLDDLQFKKYDEYLGLVIKNKIKPLVHEQIVFYKHNGVIVFIGTFDLLAMYMDKMVLCDVKTTYELDYNYLLWQLSMYALAYEQMYGVDILGLYVFWLPKRKKGLFGRVDIEGILTEGRKRKTSDDIMGVIKDYEQTDSK